MTSIWLIVNKLCEFLLSIFLEISLCFSDFCSAFVAFFLLKIRCKNHLVDYGD